MRVVVNMMSALGHRTGVGHYASELYRSLLVQPGDQAIEAFPTGLVRGACKVFSKARIGLGAGRTGRITTEQAGFRSAWRQWLRNYLRRRGRAFVGRHFRRTCRQRAYDLYHEPNYIPFRSDCLTIATVHDLSVLVHPEWHPSDRVAYHERNFRRSLGTCVHFLAVSEFTRQEIIRTLHVAPQRVTRTYNGIRTGLRPLPAAEVARVLRRLRLPPRYLLYLGTIEPRKNVLLLLQAYCSLPASLRERWPLLLVGGWGWNAQDVARYLDEEARHRGVIHVGYVRSKHLAAVYNGARALVYPSWYEGFGLPPVEMMACGGAVLSSTAAALVETVGQRAHLTDPGDRDGWRQALRRVLEDDEWVHSLRQGTTALAERFTWQRCAAETLEVYRTVASAMSSKSGPPYRLAG